MEGLNRLVAESLARHGFDRPVDYRRLHWSRWFRCESPHSLLLVPSKPGVYALAEEIMDFGSGTPQGSGNAHVGTAALGRPAEQSSAAAASTTNLEESTARRMLAVLQFGEDDDMAFVLDRMLSRQNPMRARLLAGRIFVRYVVIEDETHRRSICAALNQWMISSGEKATGIGAHFATSLELTETSVGRAPSSATAESGTPAVQSVAPDQTQPHLDSGASTNIHCPQPLPSGF